MRQTWGKQDPASFQGSAFRPALSLLEQGQVAKLDGRLAELFDQASHLDPAAKAIAEGEVRQGLSQRQGLRDAALAQLQGKLMSLVADVAKSTDPLEIARMIRQVRNVMDQQDKLLVESNTVNRLAMKAFPDIHGEGENLQALQAAADTLRPLQAKVANGTLSPEEQQKAAVTVARAHQEVASLLPAIGPLIAPLVEKGELANLAMHPENLGKSIAQVLMAADMRATNAPNDAVPPNTPNSAATAHPLDPRTLGGAVLDGLLSVPSRMTLARVDQSLAEIFANAGQAGSGTDAVTESRLRELMSLHDRFVREAEVKAFGEMKDALGRFDLTAPPDTTEALDAFTRQFQDFRNKSQTLMNVLQGSDRVRSLAAAAYPKTQGLSQAFQRIAAEGDTLRALQKKIADGTASAVEQHQAAVAVSRSFGQMVRLMGGLASMVVGPQAEAAVLQGLAQNPNELSQAVATAITMGDQIEASRKVAIRNIRD